MSEYDSVAASFAKSRRNMRWEEVDYFFSLVKPSKICDLGSGSGRLISHYCEYFGEHPKEYVGVDLSQGLILEAAKNFPDFRFIHGNFTDTKNILKPDSQENIYMIASFHHIQSLEERIMSLTSLYNILEKGGKIFMTNWALKSEVHKEKYQNSIVPGSKNEYGSEDFFIKIGKTQRFYHSFTLDELEYIAGFTGFTIIENREFDTQRNIITILQK